MRLNRNKPYTFDEWLDHYSHPANKDGCRLFKFYIDAKGYGKLSYRGKFSNAHRVSFQMKFGEITDSSMAVCHRCDVPGCINPDHMFLGTQHENLVDMAAKGRHYLGAREHCKHGHELTEENTYISSQGFRRCRICGRQKFNEWYAKRRLKATQHLPADSPP